MTERLTELTSGQPEELQELAQEPANGLTEELTDPPIDPPADLSADPPPGLPTDPLADLPAGPLAVPANRPADRPTDRPAQEPEPGELAAVAASLSGPGHGTVLLARGDGGSVVRSGRIVAKAHPAGDDHEQLAVRVHLAAHPLLHRVLLPPLPHPAPDTDCLVGALSDGRPVTLWPYGVPVPPDDPDAAPWAEAGTLLARLHAVPVEGLPGPLPPMRGPAKAAGALDRMRAAAIPSYTPAVDAVERAWAGLPRWARGEAQPPRADVLCHGDLHLGQLVRHPLPDGSWQLIDVDDLGIGPPAWDLARPAAWYAAGLLAPAAWDRFLGAYRDAGGRAVPEAGRDPWPDLEVPARALVVQFAASALAKASAGRRALAEDERAVVDTCARIAVLPRQPGM